MLSLTRLSILAFACVLSAPGMTITLNPDAGLSGNTAALDAFTRAALRWSTTFSDPISISINAGLSTAFANANIIGATSASLVQGSYTVIRDGMVLDAADEVSNAIVAALPTAGQFTAVVASGFSLQNGVTLTTANAKALGFSIGAASDGDITFNSNFSFDYDNSDGVGAGLIDFESVALHEIGHLLGFLSSVDIVDGLLVRQAPQSFAITSLDLFRFPASSAPANAAEFTTNARSLVPGQAAVWSDALTSWAMSTGVSFGDGNQASHWKDNALTGTLIGAMDPTLSSGVVLPLSSADIRALDLIGYDLAAVPEPGTFAVVGLALAIVAWRRRAV